MPKLPLLLCLALFAVNAAAQQMQLKLLKTITHRTDYIAIDRLQQFYAVSKGYHIQKYSADGRLLYEYGENNLGKIAQIDATNPLQLMVYYDEYATVLLLDRTLSPLHKVDLAALSIWRTQAICIANDNHLWLYDPQQLTLKKINPYGDILQESPDMSLLIDNDFSPSFLLESNNHLYLSDPNSGILVFDNLGNYLRDMPIKSVSQFQLWNGQLVYLNKENQIVLHDVRTLKSSILTLDINTQDLLQVLVSQERLCLRFPDRIEWYSWSKND